MKQLFEEIPSLDLNDFLNEGESKKNFVQQLGDGFQEIGFIALKNHFLIPEDEKALYKSFQDFFDLNDSTKQKYEFAHLFGQRGYVSKRKENAKGTLQADLKEFYHVGQFLPNDILRSNEYPQNIWPQEVPALAPICQRIYKALEHTAAHLLSAIALYLGLDEAYFDEKAIGGNSILRAIHYFPLQADDIVDGSVRAAAHGDINLITLLMGASAEGLEVKRNDGKWIPITALPDQLIVNVGDMLERLTNGKLKSTIHRVVNPKKAKLGKSRYSMPFFMHPKKEMSLACLTNCIDAKHTKQFDDIKAGEFLMQRLREIGLIKE